MFDLIEQAEAYPEFLPWCTQATIYERGDDWVAARLEFSYLQIRFGFQTRNAKRRPEWLRVRLVEGPFRRFQGDWRITPLGQLGCKVEFELAYEISDGLLDKVARPAVDFVSRSMMEAFVKRAGQILSMQPAASAAASPTEAAPADAPPAAAASVAAPPAATPPAEAAPVAAPLVEAAPAEAAPVTGAQQRPDILDRGSP